MTLVGDVIVFEDYAEPFEALQHIVDKLNDAEIIHPWTLNDFKTGEGWFDYVIIEDAYSPDHRDNAMYYHCVDASNVPDEHLSAMSCKLQMYLNRCGMFIKTVDFENNRFVVADQSLIVERMPDKNDMADLDV